MSIYSVTVKTIGTPSKIVESGPYSASAGAHPASRPCQNPATRRFPHTALSRATELRQAQPNRVLRCSQDFPASFLRDDSVGVPLRRPAAPPRRRWNPSFPGAGDRPARRRFRGSSSAALLASATAACQRLIGRKRSLRSAPTSGETGA